MMKRSLLLIFLLGCLGNLFAQNFTKGVKDKELKSLIDRNYLDIKPALDEVQEVELFVEDEQFIEEDRQQNSDFESGDESQEELDHQALDEVKEQFWLNSDGVQDDGSLLKNNEGFNESVEFNSSQLDNSFQRELPKLIPLGILAKIKAPVEELAIKGILIDDDEFDPGKRIAQGPSQYDSRIDIRELSPEQEWQRKILHSSRSVGIVVERDKLHAISDSIFQLDISSTLQHRYNLCPGEAFRDQPVIGIGTAFFVGPETMVTAAHVFERPLSEYVIVFGFEMVNREGGYSKIVFKRDIFYPTSILKKQDGLDVLVFNVDRPSKKPFLSLGRSSIYETNEPIYMLGYPSGLPQKVSLNASIQGESGYDFFNTTLDAFQGNSGSPVFSLESNQVIGILVSGEVDFHWNGSCNQTRDCRIPYCNGEKVIRIENVFLNE